ETVRVHIVAPKKCITASAKLRALALNHLKFDSQTKTLIVCDGRHTLGLFCNPRAFTAFGLFRDGELDFGPGVWTGPIRSADDYVISATDNGAINFGLVADYQDVEMAAKSLTVGA
ncbi:MAG: hypothetical protein ABIR91_00060, partial [Candidatus Saccharimonadales bacterium]